jgi:ferric enterobactin receptor
LRKGIFLVGFFFIALTTYAQENHGGLSRAMVLGKIVDSSSRLHLEYATITLFIGNETKPINGSTSDKSGNFKINNVKEGTYKIVIEYIGYKPFTFNNISIGNKNLVVDLKIISLAKKAGLLEAVTIALPDKIIENRIDKMVFNAEKDLTSQGGVATDILKKIPMVSVDVDGNVQLAGSSSIRFLIDGKPSTAFGSNIVDVLQSIPASQIKSVEVVTNPGAKYDAQGLGGIINIILKTNTAKGISGNLSLSAGTRLENGSFNFSARNKNFGINAFASGNTRLNAATPDNYTRISKNPIDTTTSILNQDGSSNYSRHGIQTGVGFDWTYRTKNSFSGSVNYSDFGLSGTGYNYQSQITSKDQSGNILSDTMVRNDNGRSFSLHNVETNLNYKRTFNKEDQELDLSINSNFTNNFAGAKNAQFLLPADSLIFATNARNPGKEYETEIKADYTQPFSKDVILGVGAKLTLFDINSNSDVLGFETVRKLYFYDSSLSNYLQYHQKVYAVYAELSFPLGKLFDVKVGGRYERTDTRSFYSNAQMQAPTPGYNTFVPSVFFLKKLGDDQSLKLSYSKRIERPDYHDLDPFINTTDPKNITTGNPYLKPEIGNNIELAYNRDFGAGGSLVITAFYRANNHDIQPYVVSYPTLIVGDSTYTNVSVSTRQNIGLENNIGLSLFGNINFTKKLNVRSNAFFFYRHTINAIDPGYNSNSFNYRLNLNATYQFDKTFAGEFFGNFNSARHEAQGSYPPFTTYSFAFRKQIWHKNGSVALTATNPFNEYIRRKTLISGTNFSVTNLEKIPFRSFGINFTWKFGHLDFKKNKDDNPINLNQQNEN